MTTMPSERSAFETRSRRFLPLVREIWASLAIAVMWLAVLFDAIFGPDIATQNGAGTNTTTVPSAVAVALFAWLGTWAVAHHGFRSDRD